MLKPLCEKLTVEARGFPKKKPFTSCSNNLLFNKLPIRLFAYKQNKPSRDHFSPQGRGGGGGREVIPSNRLMAMCRWTGSHFHDCIDYNGAVLSLELLEWDRPFSGFGGIRKFR